MIFNRGDLVWWIPITFAPIIKCIVLSYYDSRDHEPSHIGVLVDKENEAIFIRSLQLYPSRLSAATAIQVRMVAERAKRRRAHLLAIVRAARRLYFSNLISI